MKLPSIDDRAIWDLWLSQYQLHVVLAADELGKFRFLRGQPAGLDELCSQLALLRRSAAALTGALAAMGFLVQYRGRFQLTQLARIYLLPDSNFYWAPMLRGTATSFGHAATEALLAAVRTENLG